MKFFTMIRNALILTLLLSSHAAYASLIVRGGFSLDTGSNTITGNGLNWSRWDAVVGVSISQALGLYASDGWRLASSEEMVGMYSHFIPGVDWAASLDENSGIGEFISVDEYHALTSIFGVSLAEFGGISNVIFGNDLDNDGAYRSAGAYYTDWDPAAGIYPDSSRLTVDFSSNDFSIQLVKSISVDEPKLIYLMILGLSLPYLRKRYNSDPNPKEPMYQLIC
ncbi:hypothetical protein [Paraglaciecola sp. L1A13]|uniref:hypothetical protein n=1 Tax=Paraglaciecola sp. L1A13 TaxID=2686359 RepID=UPI00131C5971|nr:hypothetical protein [Paraglaciecola sp. L1A13]